MHALSEPEYEHGEDVSDERSSAEDGRVLSRRGISEADEALSTMIISKGMPVQCLRTESTEFSKSSVQL